MLDNLLVLPNVSYPDLVAIKCDNTCQVSNTTLSAQSAGKSDCKKSINDQETAIQFRQRNHNASFSLWIHHFHLHPVLSTLDSSAGPNWASR